MTREQWDSLCEKGQWDVKVALRGPDSYFGETLKWFTTAVIRGQMKDIFRVGGSVNPDLKLVILPKSDYHTEVIEENLGRNAWNSGHFIEHVRQAADWMGIPTLKIPRELWNSTMQHHNNRYAAKEIIDFLRIPKESTPPPADEDNIPWSPKPQKVSEALILELERHYKERLGGH